MMKHIEYLLRTILVLCLCSCKSGNASVPADNTQQDTITTFTLPTIPVMLTTPEQRADFIVKHYWGNTNFADTNYIHHPEIIEQAWADYCDLLNHVTLTTAQEAIKAAINKAGAERKVFNYMTDLADKYLYDPNSPMRNEEYYIPVLEAMITSPILNETEKIRPKARLELAQKNRVGTKALDFTYTVASGRQSTLYQIKSDYTLLFINNPGCHACTETINAIKNIPMIEELIKKKRMIILSLYPDEEVDDWRKHRSEFPSEWITAYDKSLTLKTENLYDLKAIPTLYLLDSDKTVILKDASAQAIEEWLINNISLIP